MRIRIAAVGRRMPRWVAEGFEDFRRRLPAELTLELIEIKPSRARHAGDAERARREEGEALLAAAADRRIIALEADGRSVTSIELARSLQAWRRDGMDVGLLVGGADGLDPAVRRQAAETWSLSPLTLPHMLVRVLLAEQLYRAWSMLAGHPYHRA